jgi:hypothetical protein
MLENVISIVFASVAFIRAVKLNPQISKKKKKKKEDAYETRT